MLVQNFTFVIFYNVLLLTYFLFLILLGGLDDQVNEQILHAAFIPFGDILEIQIPPDPASRM